MSSTIPTNPNISAATAPTATAAIGATNATGATGARLSRQWAFLALALLALLFCAPVALPGAAWAAADSTVFASGTGTVDDPYIISSTDQLTSFRDAVNSGNTYQGKTIKLNADISLGNQEWTPIGAGSRQSSGMAAGSTPFEGTFDGTGHTVSGLTITSSPSDDYAEGLFGIVSGGTIENLTLKDVNINVPSNKLAGSAVGLMLNDATLSNVEASGTLTANSGSGGLVGRMILTGTLENCTNNVDVTALTGTGNVGGIVGAAYYTTLDGSMVISGCTNNGTVKGTNAVGGIVGLSSAFVGDCTNNGATEGTNYSVGGVVGEQKNYGSIDNCVNTADITNSNAKGYGTGGIAGWVRYDGDASAYRASTNVAVTNNTNSGSIKGGNDAGGIVGTFYNAGTVIGNVNKAPKLSATTFAAGIVGNLQNANAGALPTGVQEGILVENNVSTTELAAIDSSLKSLYAYNNTPTDFTVKNNGTAWVAATNQTQFATLGNALDSAADGGEVALLADVAQQAPYTLSDGRTVTLNLNNRNLTFSTNPGLTVEYGTFVIEGTGTVSSADASPLQSLVKVGGTAEKPAELSIKGGSFSQDMEPYVADSFAELVKNNAVAAPYTVLPASKAHDEAEAAVTKNGHTEYYENAKDAEAAAATDPEATVQLLNTSDDTTSPRTDDTGTTPGTSTTPDTGAGTTPGTSTDTGTTPDESTGTAPDATSGANTGTAPDTGAANTSSNGSGADATGSTTESDPSFTSQVIDDPAQTVVDVTVTESSPEPQTTPTATSSTSNTTNKNTAAAGNTAHQNFPQTSDSAIALMLGTLLLAVAAALIVVLARAEIKQH